MWLKAQQFYPFYLKALDENKSGYITKEELVKHMTEEGNMIFIISLFM